MTDFGELVPTAYSFPIKSSGSQELVLPIVLQDGGLGTALELMGHNIADSPLWSASLLEKEPAAVLQAHLDFLNAGSDIIITNTYQASFEQFKRAGVSLETVPDICRGAVRLAARARRQYLSQNAERVSPKIALSVGPYGATLPSAEEYDGMYPPPFGPSGVPPRDSTIEPSQSPPTNVFNRHPEASQEEIDSEQAAEDALFAWHLRRMRLYAEDRDVWREIDIVAFETVPLAREARAIRRVMGQLSGDGIPRKPWWIAFTFPKGELPQKQYVGGPALAIDELLEATFGSVARSDGKKGEGDSCTPAGFGVNCTTPSFIPHIIRDMSTSMIERISARPPPGGPPPPWLILYPNGGLVYQPVIRKWLESTAERSGDLWVHEVLQSLATSVALELPDSQLKQIPWEGVILGGCCHTGPREIQSLRDALKKASSLSSPS